MTSINQTLENMRGTYSHAGFDVSDAHSDPLQQLEKWINEAIHSSCDEPNAFTLSTVSKNRPHSRVLLFKGIHEGKLVFYTNYLSRKGQDLDSNPFAAMNFLWLPLQRQVRIEGKITKLATNLSDAYFKSRPRGSQVGGVASPQSQIVRDRAGLEELFKIVENKYKDVDDIPRPVNWGGYALEPDYFEYWQGRENRMHDRITYYLNQKVWEKIRLAP